MSIYADRPEAYNYTLASIHGVDTIDASRAHVTKACGCKWTADDNRWVLCDFHDGYEQAVDDIMSANGNVEDMTDEVSYS